MNVTTTTMSEQRGSSGWVILRGLRSLIKRWTGAQSGVAFYSEGRQGGRVGMPRKTEAAIPALKKGARPVCEDCQLPMYAADFVLWPNSKICSDCRLRRRLLGCPHAFRFA